MDLLPPSFWFPPCFVISISLLFFLSSLFSIFNFISTVFFLYFKTHNNKNVVDGTMWIVELSLTETHSQFINAVKISFVLFKKKKISFIYVFISWTIVSLDVCIYYKVIFVCWMRIWLGLKSTCNIDLMDDNTKFIFASFIVLLFFVTFCYIFFSCQDCWIQL